MAFCTQTQLEKKLSPMGVQLIGDYDLVGAASEGVVEQAIEAGDSDIQFFCGSLYSDAALASCTWINHAAIALSCWHYCGNRNEPIPQSVQANYEVVIKRLEMVHAGTYQLPGIAFRNKHAPFVTNQRIVMGYRTKKARTERTISTPGPVQHPRNLEMESEREAEGNY